MELRLKDKLVRMRLTRGEVETLRASGFVTSRTEFTGGRELCHALESSPASVQPTAFFKGNTVTVRLPESAVLDWASSKQPSLCGEQLLDDGQLLRILVEKDFAGLAEREDEGESEMFPPLAAKGS